MSTEPSVSLRQLKERITEINNEISKLQEKRKHIELVIDECFPAMELRMLPASTMRHPIDGKKEAIIRILKKAERPMKSSEIFSRLPDEGVIMDEGTFHWLMSNIVRDPNSHISKPRYAYYEYSAS